MTNAYLTADMPFPYFHCQAEGCDNDYNICGFPASELYWYANLEQQGFFCDECIENATIATVVEEVHTDEGSKEVF